MAGPCLSLFHVARVSSRRTEITDISQRLLDITGKGRLNEQLVSNVSFCLHDSRQMSTCGSIRQSK